MESLLGEILLVANAPGLMLVAIGMSLFADYAVRPYQYSLNHSILLKWYVYDTDR